MPIRQKIFALIVCCVVVVFTIELVRRRRLKEEYSVLWLCTSVVMFILVLKYDWLVILSNLIGAALPTSTLFVGALVFLMLVAVQFSMQISELSMRVKNLAQDNALLRAKVEQWQQTADGGGTEDKCIEMGKPPVTCNGSMIE